MRSSGNRRMGSNPIVCAVCIGGCCESGTFLLYWEVHYTVGMEVALIEGIESDSSVTTVMNGAAKMLEFEPDWIVAICAELAFSC